MRCPDSREPPGAPDALPQGPACSAQIGFEEGGIAGVIPLTAPDNAFVTVQNGSGRALCGARALELSARFAAVDGVLEGRIELDLPPVLRSASGSLALWVYVEGPPVPPMAGAPGLEAFLTVDPIAMSDPFLGALTPGVWTRLAVAFTQIPSPVEVPTKVSFRIFYPRGDWTGVIYLDEVGWQLK